MYRNGDADSTVELVPRIGGGWRLTAWQERSPDEVHQMEPLFQWLADRADPVAVWVDGSVLLGHIWYYDDADWRYALLFHQGDSAYTPAPAVRLPRSTTLTRRSLTGRSSSIEVSPDDTLWSFMRPAELLDFDGRSPDYDEADLTELAWEQTGAGVWGIPSRRRFRKMTSIDSSNR